MRFLAAPVGREVVEFAAGGDVRITTDAEDVSVYTAENEPTFTVVESPEIFTQIANRQASNPDVEHMLYLQQVNIERRMAILTEEMESRIGQAYDAGTKSVTKSDAPGTAAERPLGEVQGLDAHPGTSGGNGATAKRPAETGYHGDDDILVVAGDDGSQIRPKPKV